MYEDIAQKVNSDTALDTAQTEYLFLLRRAVTYYAVSYMIPLKVTSPTAAGMTNSNSERTTQTSLSEIKFSLWQVTRLADTHLDTLLDFLENQVQDGNSYFDPFKNAPEHNRGTTPFFRRTQHFQDYFNIFTSRPTFLALTPHIADISEDLIQPILCGDLFTQIATEITKNELTPQNKTLLHHIRRALAPLAVAKAAPYLAIITESDGFKIVSNTEGMDKREAATRQHQAAIASLVERCRADGEDRINKLRKFLTDNITDYPLYAASKCYKLAQRRQTNFGINVITDNGIGAFITKKR
jgi:hypothetical protein